MNQEARKEHERMKDGVARALGLASATWAWEHLLSKIRENCCEDPGGKYRVMLAKVLGGSAKDWHGMLGTVRELVRRANSAFRMELMEILGAKNAGPSALLEAARKLKERALPPVREFNIGHTPGGAVSINGVRYVREETYGDPFRNQLRNALNMGGGDETDEAVVEAVRTLHASYCASLHPRTTLPCPRRHRVLGPLIVRCEELAVDKGLLIVDKFICPGCDALVGLTLANSGRPLWVWNRLVELAPARPPDVFKKNRVTVMMGTDWCVCGHLRADHYGEKGGCNLRSDEHHCERFRLRRMGEAAPLGGSLLEDLVAATRGVRDCSDPLLWLGDEPVRSVIKAAMAHFVEYIQSAEGRMSWERAYDTQPQGGKFPRDEGYQAMWLMLERLLVGKKAASPVVPDAVKDLLGDSEEAQRHFNARIIEAYERGFRRAGG